VVASYRTKIEWLQRCGADIITVGIARPPGYTFRAGQWFRLTVDTPAGPQTRTLSHASAPGDDWVELTTRLSSSEFKRSLGVLDVGAEVEIGPSGGRLTLPSSDERLTALVGGVGITPLRSLLRDARQSGTVFKDALVVYGNRDVSCEPYVSELLEMQDVGVRLVRVLERADDDWTGEWGFITAEMLARYGGADNDRAFVIAGPPVMVQAMRRVLSELDISDDRVRVEAFGRMDRVTG
jgi:glycine betaine catabolism B